jgi:cytochrome c553
MRINSDCILGFHNRLTFNAKWSKRMTQQASHRSGRNGLWRVLAPLLALGLSGVTWAAQAVVPVADDIATGAKLAEKHCAACHGANGQGATIDFASLAGQNEMYIAKQLRDFAAGERDSTVMDSKASVLSECSIRAVAKFYQGQVPKVTPSKDPILANAGQFVYERGNPYAGLPACVSCHGTGGRGNAELPRLAGQNPRYMERQLKNYVSRTRAGDSAAVMTMVASRMTEMEMKAVVEYLGAMK